MDSRRVYIVVWRSDPDGVDLEGNVVAGAFVNVYLIADDLSDALILSKQIAIEEGWLPDSIPTSFSLYFEHEIHEHPHPEIREYLQRAVDEGPWCLNLCYKHDDPLYNKECDHYIWLLDWEADNESDPDFVHIEDACAHMAVFLKCEGLLEVVDEGWEWIQSMGWNPDDEPRWAERLVYSDIDDRVHPQYQIPALEAFRDGHSIYIQVFPRAEGYPERIFPLCEPEETDD